MEKTGAREAMDASQEGNKTGEQIQTSLEGVVSMEPDTATSGTEDKVVDMPDENSSGDPSHLADSASDRAIEQGAGSDHVVDIPAAVAVELLEAIEKGAGSDHGKPKTSTRKKTPRPLW